MIIELLNENDRVYGNVILGTVGTLGSLLFGVAVMFEHDFRIILRMFSLPGMITCVYFWFISESLQWLLATGNIDRAIIAMKRIAKFNGFELSEKSIESIKQKYSPSISAQEKSDEHGEEQSVLRLFWKMLKTRTLCFRFCKCCFQWIAGTFSTLGLYQFAIQIPGVDRYVSYLIMISADVFGTILVQLLLNRVKRKTLLFSAYFLVGISIVVTSFIPREYPWIVVFCFLIAKCFINLADVVMSLYTNELFPTNIRSTVMSIVGMVAQIGAIGAPYIVILVRH